MTAIDITTPEHKFLFLMSSPERMDFERLAEILPLVKAGVVLGIFVRNHTMLMELGPPTPQDHKIIGNPKVMVFKILTKTQELLMDELTRRIDNAPRIH